MNNIEIRKYEYQNTRAKNYFASPTYIDGIILDKILIDGFPIFNEEFQNQFDSFEYVSSDYDLVFSRLESTLTTVNSDSLETFLSTDLDNHCLVCKVTIGSKTFGGLIDVNSIVFIDNLDSDGYKIKITVFSMAKELSLATMGNPFTLFGDINLVITQLLGSGIDGFAIDPFLLTFDQSNLNFVSRVGYNPTLITELYSFLKDNDRLLGATAWKLFEDLCTSFGIIYKINVTGNSGNYFTVTVSLAFRDTGFSASTISVDWVDRERGFIRDINANVIQCFKHQKAGTIIGTGTVPIQVNEDLFYGTVFNKDNITTADGYIYALGGGFGEENLASNGDGFSINKFNNPFPFDVADKVNFVEMNYYFPTNYSASSGRIFYYILSDTSNGFNTDPQVLQVKYISFPRMFTKAGYVIGPQAGTAGHNARIIYHPDGIHSVWYDLIENSGGVCYPYLLQTFKKYVSGTVALLTDFDINLFDKIVVNQETYTIFKLSNLDFQNKEVDVFAIQD